MSVTRTGSRKGMMLRKAMMVLFGMLCAFELSAISGYKITLKSNLKDHKVYIWYNYGENKYPLDTSMTNEEGVAVFDKPYQLTGGVFILYLTPRKALEFLLTDENIFTINVDTANISGKTTFTGSRENNLYYEFLRKVNYNNYQKGLIEDKYKQYVASNKTDSLALLKSMIAAYEKQEEVIQQQTIAKNPNTFLADLISASMRIRKTHKTLKDVKAHFFDRINFADERLAYSPVLFNIYEEYIQDYTYKSGDSLIAGCDTILKKAAAGKENFKWSLYFLTSSFERSAVTGQDQVFVHLVEEYYKKGKCWWLTKEQIDNMVRRAEVLKHLFVGSACPDFTATDTSGKEVTLYSKIKGLTVLYFWAYDCKHCLEETPKLVTWMKQHPTMHLITACATPDEDKWKEKLKEFNMPGFHFIDPELKANYNYIYSITATPQIFVIDKNKKILGKYIDDTKALDEFMKQHKLVH